ncbi:MAG TPA: hypothetical protein VJ385_06735 [Fibrobacteria bacterium]|nr:hypothetical protein [Fibrobacteria bacterium]
MNDPILEIRDFARYIRIDYKDVVDFGKQKRMLDMIHGMYLDKGVRKFIVNAKGCRVNYSILERHKIGEYVAEKFKTHIIFACIIDAEQLTGIVENTSHNRGGTGLKIVTTEQEALDWIGER